MTSSRAASPPRVLRIGQGRAGWARVFGTRGSYTPTPSGTRSSRARRSAIATARAQGQAALERARGEVAATRALANAARMVADQPALLQLRTLQAIEAGGATVVLSAGPDVTGAALGIRPEA